MKARPNFHENRGVVAAVLLVPAGRRFFVALLCVLVSSGIWASEEPPLICADIDASSVGPSSLIFVDGFELGDTTVWIDPMPAFSATEILDIVFTVGFDADLVGEHSLELRISTPNGHLYQVLTELISSDTTKNGAEIRVAGFPYPLQVCSLTPRVVGEKSISSVSSALPVGGTLIVTNSLYGVWEIEPLLDGSSVACGGPTRFMLIQ